MTDVFRKEYKEMDSKTKEAMEEIKNKAQELYNIIDGQIRSDNGREIALAKTNLEQSIMWAVKGITA
jgi:hypothetical protein